MIIQNFTVKVCRQSLSTKSTAKDNPYLYKAEEPNFSKLTTDELNHLYLSAMEIAARLQNMLDQRK